MSATKEKIEAAARAMALHAGWHGWDTATDFTQTLDGSDPADERDYWRGLARVVLESIPSEDERVLRDGEKQHDSDCALHNAPALPVGPCDCSVSLQAVVAVPEGLQPVRLKLLSQAFQMIDPAPVEVDGKLMVFVNPNASSVLTSLSAVIREMVVTSPPYRAPQPAAAPSGDVERYPLKVTDAMVKAAEETGDLYRLGKPELIRMAIRNALDATKE